MTTPINFTQGDDFITIQWRDDLWTTIRRLDGTKLVAPTQENDQSAASDIVKRAIPNFSGLQWHKIEPSDLSHGEWTAEDGEFRVNIYGNPGGQAWHEQVLASYQDLVRSIGTPTNAAIAGLEAKLAAASLVKTQRGQSTL